MNQSTQPDGGTVVRLPTGTVTQPKKQFVLRAVQRSHKADTRVIQVFKRHPQGSRRHRLMIASLMRSGMRRNRFQQKHVRKMLIANFETMMAAKGGSIEALTVLMNELVIAHNIGPKGYPVIERVLRRELGLPDIAEVEDETPVADSEAVA